MLSPSLQLDLGQLSEIEKYVLLVMNESMVSESRFISDTSLPGWYIELVLAALLEKGLIHIVPSSNGDTTYAIVDSSILAALPEQCLNVKGPVGLPGDSVFSRMVVSRLDAVLQEAIDLHGLSYNKDAAEKVREFILMVTLHVVPSLDIVFHPLDEYLLSSFCTTTARFSRFPTFALDFVLSLLVKFLQLLKVNLESPVPVSALITAFLNSHGKFFLNVSQFIMKRLLSNGIPENDMVTPLVFLNCIVCHFNKKIGPSVFYQMHAGLPDGVSDRIAKLMDIENKEAFSFTIDRFVTFNLQFFVDSPVARGQKESLQVSLLADEKQPFSPLIRTLLEQLATGMCSIEGLYLLFTSKDSPMGDAAGEGGVLARSPLFTRFLKVLSLVPLQALR